MGFLAIDIGFSLYNPNRLNPVLPFSTLKIIGGNTQVQTKYSLTWEKAVDGMVLEPGSRVKTDSGSYASLSFSQGTTTKLEPGTDVIVAKLEINPDNELNAVTLKQQSGKTWNQVTRLADDSYHFQIQTPSADVKVRGTLFATEVDEMGKTTVQTTEGSVNVSAQGKEVQVPAGQQIIVTPGAAPSAPSPIPPARNEAAATSKATPKETALPTSKVNDQEKTSGQPESWFHLGDNDIDNQWVVISGIVVLLAGLLVLAWKKI